MYLVIDKIKSNIVVWLVSIVYSVVYTKFFYAFKVEPTDTHSRIAHFIYMATHIVESLICFTITGFFALVCVASLSVAYDFFKRSRY